MKIELNIETSQLGDTVIELFNSLTVEQKQQIALEVLKGWFQEPNIIEKTAMEGIIVNKLRTSGERENRFGSNTPFRDMTDDEIKKTYRFSDEMKAFKSSKTIMVEDIKGQMISFFKKEMNTELQKDPMVTKAMTTAINTIKEALPQIVAEAMIKQFTEVVMNQQFNLYGMAMRTVGLSQAINDIGRAINLNNGQPIVDSTDRTFEMNPTFPPGYTPGR